MMAISMRNGLLEDDRAEDPEFFDAFQSFSDIPHDTDDGTGNRYTYPPARSMQMSGTDFNIETAPKQLLYSAHSMKFESANPLEIPTMGESTAQIRNSLVTSHNDAGITTHGYPGQLTDEELEACLKFRDELKTRDPVYREMVRAYAPAESEAFALCRFLRARNFDVDAVFAMLNESDAVGVWKEAREHNFYRDFEGNYGCPLSVFMALYPVVTAGIAKNGATMLYFKPSNMDIHGLECVCNVSDLLPMLWDLLHNRGTNSMLREAKSHDPQTTKVLAERIIVMDLKGMPPKLMNRDFFGLCGKTTCCFPESMNRTYMVNTPMTFQVVWTLAKMFMDERTLRKIGFFSNVARAKNDFLEYVEADELLSTYGGTGPSFEEVMAMRQAECCDEYKQSRFVTKTLCVSRYETKMKFELKANEKISSIKVYSKGDNGATFHVESHRDDTVFVEPTTVSRSEGSDKLHYSVELDSSKIPSGKDGSFIIKATGPAKEFFLVTIHIYS